MTRIGASQVFFNVVAQWNADKMVSDAKTQMTIMKAVVLDSFEAMLKPVDDFTNNLNMMTAELSEASQELGKAKVEFEKFFGSDNLDATAEALIEIGEAYAIVGSEALDAGSRAAQVANLIGQQNVDILVKQANILSAISDLNAEEAQRGMIQLQQQTGLLTANMTSAQFKSLSVLEQRNLLIEQSGVMLDTLNTIANRSVAMEGDLVKTLANFAAQGDLVGESFHFMAAASATLLEAGEEQGASGRALRMMYARLGGNISGTRDKLEAMGIATKDANGELLNMEDFMQGLIDGGYRELNSEQKQNIAQIVSGNRHYVRFIKLMENHNRIVQLAADGMEGYDSATAQADKAMQSLTMQLEKQRAIQENLDAALGQKMTPFMIGQLQASNSMKEAYVELMDVMPTFGNILGRLVGSFEQFEGFLRFSIGLQSMAIGFEMMDSVQRSLHGILIANENLHSKQATHLEYGVQASKDQNAMMNRIRYQAQLVNTHQESIRFAKHEQMAIDLRRLPALQMEKDLTATIAEKSEQIEETDKQRENIAYRLKTLGDGRLNDATKINRIIAQDRDFAKEMATTFHQIRQGQFDASIKEQSYASQMLTNMQAANGLSEEQLQDQYATVAALKDQRAVMQMLQSENQVAYQLRSNQRGLDEDQVRLSKEVSFNVNDLAKAYNLMNRDLEVQNALILKNAGDTEKEVTARARAAAQAKVIQEVMEKTQLAMQEMNANINNKDGPIPITPFDLGKQGAGYVTGVITQINGELMSRTKILETATLKEMDMEEVTRRRTAIEKTLNELQQEKLVDMNKLQTIMDPLLKDEEAYAKLQEKINKAVKDRVDAEKIKQEIMYALEGGLDSLSDQTKKLVKVDQDYRREKELAAQATNKMMMATSSLVTIVSGSGMFGLTGSMAAATSSVMMLAPAFVTVGKSVQEYIKNQMTMMKLQKQTNWFMTRGALTLGGMVAAYGLAIIFISAMNKQREKEVELMKEINDASATFINVNDRLYGDVDQQLIQNKALNEQLGLNSITLRELYNDEQRRLEVIQKLTAAQGDFSGEMGASVDEALKLSHAISSVSDGMNTMMINSFISQQGSQMSRSMFGEALDRTLLRINAASKDVKEANDDMFDLIEEQGLRGDQYVLGGQRMAKATDIQLAIEKQIRSGKKLDKGFMDSLRILYGHNEEFIRYVEVLNSMVISTSDAELAQRNFEMAIDNTSVTIGQTADDIQNLTEEIYQFSGAREELFFGGKYGNVTGSLYKQVVTQGVGTLYNKNEVIVSNNFHGFFNEQEAADKIISIVTQHLNTA